jgi:crossover junction endodeoxyribonuclease RuvC
MRVLGIDCGTHATGFGVIESDGVRHQMIVAGVIETSAKESLAVRVLQIAQSLRSVIERYRPEAAAVESIFHAVNTKSALKLAHARGVALLAVAEAGLPLGEYSPLEIKTSVVGYGRAEKYQVQLMVQSLLGLESALESEDASDAVAVAICHVTRMSFAQRLGAAV